MEKEVMILTGAGQIGMSIARTIAKIMNDAGFDVEPVEMDLSSCASIMNLIAEAKKTW